LEARPVFGRVAIINRAEAAMRLIHAVRELCAQTGARIETVAFYTDVDRTATFVRAADRGYDLGPASAQPYLDLAVLERALRESGADAAWAGWGFVAGNPAFAELCERLGVTFVGPAAQTMRRLGDKIGARLLAEKAGLPVASCRRGPVDDLARRVEVPVIADGQGRAWALGVRDCPVRQGHRKVIVESAFPAQAGALKTAARRLALAAGYRGVGTVAFLCHPGDQQFTFLKVSMGLPADHPVTELTTGMDLVTAQLQVAAGGKLLGRPPAGRGHAIEARLNAEDPERDFAPSPGRIVRLDLPAGPGIRVDTGVRAGDGIPACFDPTIAKIIAYGRDRDEARGRLRRALAQTTVIIAGGVTNKSFLLDLLDQPEMIEASAGRHAAPRGSAVALAVDAIGV
jgi:acetyl/propionyl-CoA carboxylase alpha subunit